MEEIIKIQLPQHDESNTSLNTIPVNSNIQIEEIELEDKILERSVESLINLTSGICVIGTSLISGFLKFNEYIDDGTTWIAGTTISKIFEIIGKEDIADNIKIDIQKKIAIDTVEEINKSFYENTELGKYINENSTIKYDGQIRDISTKLTEYAIATGAVISSGGTLTPYVLGILFGIGELEGIGQSAENRYQTQADNYETKNILLDGVAGGLNMIGNAISYMAISNFIKYNLSIHSTGVKGVMKNIFSRLNNPIFGIGNLLESGGVVINNFTNTYSVEKNMLSTELIKEYFGGIALDGFSSLIF